MSAARHHADLVMCRKQPGAAAGKLCEKCDGRCVLCDSYVRPSAPVRVCDECNFGAQQGRCIICGGQGVSEAYYCRECTLLEKDRDGCPKIVNLGSARLDMFYEKKKFAYKPRLSTNRNFPYKGQRGLVETEYQCHIYCPFLAPPPPPAAPTILPTAFARNRRGGPEEELMDSLYLPGSSRTTMSSGGRRRESRGVKRIYPVKRLLIFLALGCIVGIFVFRPFLMRAFVGPVVGRIQEWRKPPEPVIIYREPPKTRLELRTTFSGLESSNVHQQYGSGMDACRILMQCFKGSEVYGEQEVCKRNLDPTIKYYDSGFMVEVIEGQEDRLVGFVSVHHDVSYRSRTIYMRQQQKLPPQQEDYHALIMYNVCVDEERRGQGVAKKMIPQFIDALVKHYKLERYAQSNGVDLDSGTGRPVPPLLVGLDVDLTSDTMPEAFSLYAKLGFVRWWTPCTSVANHKWTALIDTQMNYKQPNQGYSELDRRDAHGNVKRPTGLLPTHNGDFPISRLLWDPEPYLQNAFNLGTTPASASKPPGKPNHFCMYKFYSDSFMAMGKRLMEYQPVYT